jgi:hypothetical protein
VLGWAWSSGQNIEDHAFARKYLTASTVTLEIADGVSAVLPLSRDAIGLAFAELHQEAGNLDQAVTVVEALDPSVIAAVSLAAQRHDRGLTRTCVASVTGQELGRGEPSAALRTLRYLVGHHGPPPPVVDGTRSQAAGHNPVTAMQGPTTGQGTDPNP